MTDLMFHTEANGIPAYDEAGTIHVHLYGARPSRQGTGSIGRTLVPALERLGASVDPLAIDFLSIALSVIAADTFVHRERHSGNGWSRELSLRIPVARREIWSPLTARIEQALRFLSGDDWRLAFVPGGRPPPTTGEIQRRHRTHVGINGADCVCLFSGGLDSLIGAKSLVNEGRTPLLVSHSYRGDQGYQVDLAKRLGKAVPRFAANANPVFSGDNSNDTTMRTRSLGFLAYGVVAASALSSLASLGHATELFIPENGFIALNAPLTRRRIGSHSTRTTHPEFLSRMQEILSQAGLPVRIENRFRHRTKGEMLEDLATAGAFAEATVATVSCGKWKRSNQQCGHCVPCLIRRAAFAKAGIADTTDYRYVDLWKAWDRPSIRDDVMAMVAAVSQPPDRLRRNAIASGALPLEDVERDGWFGVHKRGLLEVRSFLESQGFAC